MTRLEDLSADPLPYRCHAVPAEQRERKASTEAAAGIEVGHANRFQYFSNGRLETGENGYVGRLGGRGG